MQETGHIQVARDGRFYSGHYKVEDEAVIVDYGDETKIAPLDGLDAESRARMTLGTMVGAPPPSDSPGRRTDGPSADYGAAGTEILSSLGAAVLVMWDELPQDVQRELFEAASCVLGADDQETVRQRIAVFLHDNKLG